MINCKSPQLLNVTYVKPNRFNGDKECFEVVYRDDHGRVCYSNEPADVDIYFTKPELREPVTYHRPEVQIERLNKHRVPFSKIRRAIENEMGEIGHNYYRQCIQEQRYQDLDKLYTWPHSFRADFQPEFYFRHEWHCKYGVPSQIKLSSVFIDIEIDQIDSVVNFDDIPNSATCPVNCTTLIFDDSREVFLFVLKPFKPSHSGRSESEYRERYALYERQLASYNEFQADRSKFYDKIHALFDEKYGRLNYTVLEYDEEINMIRDIFRYINERKPNFCLSWNMRFDIQYLFYRIIQLGHEPADIICHPEFTRKTCYFKLDKTAFEVKHQFDYLYCSSYTIYVCQMRVYSAIRKSQHAIKSTKLDYIAQRELGDKKLDINSGSDGTGSGGFVMAAYNDLIWFWIYNIKDVLLQLGIESVVHDVMTFYMRSLENCTPYQKIFRETYLLRNVREIYFNEDGWTQGNNINRLRLQDAAKQQQIDFNRLEESIESSINADDSEETVDEGSVTFKGAIMADPMMNDMVGDPVIGRPSNTVFRNCMDFDMGSFYPSIKVLSNMSAITLISKAILIHSEFRNEVMSNRSLNQVYEERDKNGKLRYNDHTGEAVNTFLSGNTLTFGYNWLHYPDISELYTIIKRTI